ncbi:MAG TPA: nitrile hydratase subunit alpha [Nitrososphaerales archaeon]|nr:nitrile hydratase subunit alpha [Nitrososphaerales archaeon]
MSSHMHDYEDHIRAIVEDLGYWRAKRFEATVFRFARLGTITLYDIVETYPHVQLRANPQGEQPHYESEMEAKIRPLEIALGDYIKGVMIVESVPVGDVVIDDLRKETGIYDKFFAIAKKSYSGSLDRRVDEIATDLKKYQEFLDAFTLTLIRKGFMTEEEFASKKEAIKKSSVENGGRIVARAWIDPHFKEQLLSNARDAVRDFGTPLSGTPNLIVVEDTESIHNVVVCTLCSCYPYDLLGNPPWWYKHDDYKKAIVNNPRETLKTMFNLSIPDGVEIRVHDSTSDIRYMVLPKRPPNTERLSEQELATLITSESLIGAAEPLKSPVVA